MDEADTDYYAVLGVNRGCGADEIKKAYHRECLAHHPDKNPTDPKATATFQGIQKAYEILSDDEKRTEYDLRHTPVSSEWTQRFPTRAASSPDSQRKQPRPEGPRDMRRRQRKEDLWSSHCKGDEKKRQFRKEARREAAEEELKRKKEDKSQPKSSKKASKQPREKHEVGESQEGMTESDPETDFSGKKTGGRVLYRHLEAQSGKAAPNTANWEQNGARAENYQRLFAAKAVLNELRNIVIDKRRAAVDQEVRQKLGLPPDRKQARALALQVRTARNRLKRESGGTLTDLAEDEQILTNRVEDEHISKAGVGDVECFEDITALVQEAQTMVYHAADGLDKDTREYELAQAEYKECSHLKRETQEVSRAKVRLQKAAFYVGCVEKLVKLGADERCIARARTGRAQPVLRNDPEIRRMLHPGELMLCELFQDGLQLDGYRGYETHCLVKALTRQKIYADKDLEMYLDPQQAENPMKCPGDAHEEYSCPQHMDGAPLQYDPFRPAEEDEKTYHSPVQKDRGLHTQVVE